MKKYFVAHNDSSHARMTITSELGNEMFIDPTCDKRSAADQEFINQFIGVISVVSISDEDILRMKGLAAKVKYGGMIPACLREPLRILQTEFEVRDALGGSLQSDYTLDIERLNEMGYTTTKKIYDEADQNTHQP